MNTAENSEHYEFNSVYHMQTALNGYNSQQTYETFGSEQYNNLAFNPLIG